MRCKLNSGSGPNFVVVILHFGKFVLAPKPWSERLRTDLKFVYSKIAIFLWSYVKILSRTPFFSSVYCMDVETLPIKFSNEIFSHYKTCHTLMLERLVFSYPTA